MPLIPLEQIETLSSRQLRNRYSLDDLNETLSHYSEPTTTIDQPPPRAEKSSSGITQLPEGADARTFFSTLSSNLVPSFKQNVQGVVDMVSDPKTAWQSTKTIGRGALDYFQDKDTPQSQAAREAFKSQMPSLENFAEDPVGQVANVGTVLSGGLGAASKIPALSRLSKYASAIGHVADPIGTAVALPIQAGVGAAKLGRRTAAELTGAATGKGGDIVGDAYEAGKLGGVHHEAFKRYLKQKPLEGEELEGLKGTNLVTDDLGDPAPYGATALQLQTKQEMKKARNMAGKDYDQAMEELNLGEINVDINDMRNKMREVLKEEYNVNFDENGLMIPGINDIEKSKFTPLQNELNVILDPTLTSLNGRDLLSYKKSFAAFDANPDVSTSASNKMYGIIKEHLYDAAPEMKSIDQKYASQAEKLKFFRTNLGVDENVQVPGKKEAAVASASQDSPALAQKKQALDEYGKYMFSNFGIVAPIKSRRAGQILSEYLPSSLWGRGAAVGLLTAASNWGAIFSLPLFSPRLVGSVAGMVGKRTGQLERALEKLQKLQSKINILGVGPNRETFTIGQAIARLINEEDNDGDKQKPTLLQQLGR